MKKTNEKIISFLEEQELCVKKIIKNHHTLTNIIEELIKARDKRLKVFTMGNGGSASTASHFVSDLLKTAITKGDKRFNATSLVDNFPIVSAWSNDSSYEDVFAEQLKNYVSKGDLVIAFSGSGKSKNVLKAMKIAKKNGAICIGFTGMDGGKFPTICDICYIVPSNDMLSIESMHLLLCHCIISTIRDMGKPLFTYN